jgi:hypothetical protein
MTRKNSKHDTILDLKSITGNWASENDYGSGGVTDQRYTV